MNDWNKEIHAMLATIEKNKKTEEKVGTVVGVLIAAVLFIPLVIYNVWANAYVGSTLWEWFIVSKFGLPSLTMMQAWGISLLVSMWTHQHTPWKGTDEREPAAKIGELIGLLMLPWFFLGMGWIAKTLM